MQQLKSLESNQEREGDQHQGRKELKTYYLCAEYHKEGPSSIEFSCTSLLNYLVSESNFESWLKLLGPPLLISKTLRGL